MRKSVHAFILTFVFVLSAALQPITALAASVQLVEGLKVSPAAPEPKEADPQKDESKEVVFYFVRHGKTISNTRGQVQGWIDSFLTDVGVQGAQDLARGLKNVPFTAAYSSDLGRARSTAKYILAEGSRGNMELTELAGLREWNYGGYEGLDDAVMWQPIFDELGLTLDAEWSQWEELTKRLTDEQIADKIHDNDVTGAAEKYSDITTRAKAAAKQMTDETLKKGGGNVLVVSHGSQIPTILELMAPGQYKGDAIKNCSVTILTYKDGNYTIGAVGDMSYLEKGKK